LGKFERICAPAEFPFDLVLRITGSDAKSFDLPTATLVLFST